MVASGQLSEAAHAQSERVEALARDPTTPFASLGQPPPPRRQREREREPASRAPPPPAMPPPLWAQRLEAWSNRQPQLTLRRLLWLLTGLPLAALYLGAALGLALSLVFIPFVPSALRLALFALDGGITREPRAAEPGEFGCVLGRPVKAENILEANQPTNQPTTH